MAMLHVIFRDRRVGLKILLIVDCTPRRSVFEAHAENRRKSLGCSARICRFKPRSKTRLKLLHASLLAGAQVITLTAALSGVPVRAQDYYPTRVVRIVYPFPAGSANDIGIRMVAAGLSKIWKQAVIVENRPGASSIIGTQQVVKAEPDGHTLLATITILLQNTALGRSLPYDLQRDLAPVAQVFRAQLAVFASGNSSARTLGEMFERGKAQPDKYNYASFGLGSTTHMINAKIMLYRGAAFTHVPYRGGAEIVAALLAGDAEIGVADFLSPAPHIKSGKLRVIGVTGPKRVSFYPDAPTLAEAGVSGFEAYNWLGVFAPASTPASVVRKINADINTVLADPEVSRRMVNELVVEPASLSDVEFAQVVRNDLQSWTTVIKQTGIKPE